MMTNIEIVSNQHAVLVKICTTFLDTHAISKLYVPGVFVYMYMYTYICIYRYIHNVRWFVIFLK